MLPCKDKSKAACHLAKTRRGGAGVRVCWGRSGDAADDVSPSFETITRGAWHARARVCMRMCVCVLLRGIVY